MNPTTVDQDCDAYWTGRLIATVAIARTALQAKNTSYAKTLLGQELRDFNRSPLCDATLQEILKKL